MLPIGIYLKLGINIGKVLFYSLSNKKMMIIEQAKSKINKYVGQMLYGIELNLIILIGSVTLGVT